MRVQPGDDVEKDQALLEIEWAFGMPVDTMPMHPIHATSLREDVLLATYHFRDNRSESQWNSIVQCQTPLNPIPADTEEALVPPISAVDKVTKSALDHTAA